MDVADSQQRQELGKPGGAPFQLPRLAGRYINYLQRLVDQTRSSVGAN